MRSRAARRGSDVAAGAGALTARAQPDRAPSPDPAATSADQTILIRQAELIISNVLRGGVLLSAVVIAAGVIAFYWRYLAAGGRGVSNRPFPHNLTGVAQGLSSGDPLAIIALGLLILLATPVLRVAVSIVAFALERDWRYTVITSLVLAILIVSFLLGRGGA
jgi:uncharacterized membrane protein